VNIWSHIAKHGEEIGWAAGLAIVFAIIFAVIADILRIGSRTREGIRHLQNQWSEQSTSRLTKRIAQLKDYQRKLADVRWLYLFAFQTIFLILFLFSMAATCWILSFVREFRVHPQIVDKLIITSLYCAALGGGLAILGFRHVWRDTQEKVQTVVHKIGLEIEGLEKKLAKRS
jgi:hypothetical protein